MKVILRNPRREVDLEGVRRVSDLFKRLELVSESYLAIRQGELLTTDDSGHGSGCHRAQTRYLGRMR